LAGVQLILAAASGLGVGWERDVNLLDVNNCVFLVLLDRLNGKLRYVNQVF
jgi:hypothetical protein